jgi:pyruvate/2-oxoglutarate dehydrogenase complex dihydrolipoamide acyltransferase (E2) component
MFGSINKAGLGLTFLHKHTLGMTVGDIQTKPVVVADDGTIVAREMLSLTLIFDHDVVDGAPAARFVSRLVEEIESAALLKADR